MVMLMLFGCGNSSELNLQVEARDLIIKLLATLEKLYDEVCNYTSCFVFILRQIMYLFFMNDYGEETKRVFISANNYGERCLCFLPHPRMQIQMDLMIMDMQIKMVHTLLQK
ncbi:hypothetical protein AAG906_040386 [Vitis piasezkii]